MWIVPAGIPRDIHKQFFSERAVDNYVLMCPMCHDSGAAVIRCLERFGSPYGDSGDSRRGGLRMDAVAILSDEVREIIRRSGLDPGRDATGVRRVVEAAVAGYDERSLTRALPPIADAEGAVKQVLDAVVGFGALQPFLDDPAVEEIWINEPGKVFVARAGTSELTTTILTPEDVRDLVERMLKSSGRRVDLSCLLP